MNREKLLALLGFAKKSRSLVQGESLTLEKIKQEGVYLVILATDVSANTAKRISDKAAYRNIPVVSCFSRTELGQATGRTACVVVGITDRQFARSMHNFTGGEALAKTKSLSACQGAGSDQQGID